MLYFRACPRCKTGAIEHNSDPYGGYLECLNCGFMRDLPAGTDIKAELRRLHSEFNAQIAAELAGEPQKTAVA